MEKYQAGETAFIIAGANFLKIIKENALQIYKNSDISKQISGSSGKVDFSIMNLVIPKKSKNHKNALDFALFLTNSENQLEFCKLAPILPSAKEALKSEFFKNYDKNDLISKGRFISSNQLNNALKPLPRLKNQKDFNEIIDIATQKSLLLENTPEEALENATKDWNKILSEN